MIWQIDTTKIPDKEVSFLAEVILLSKKSNCTIDESIELMKELLRGKK
jgi:hypothetical protein